MKSENGGAGHVIGAMLERFREKEPPVPGENEYIGEKRRAICCARGYRKFRVWFHCHRRICAWRFSIRFIFCGS